MALLRGPGRPTTPRSGAARAIPLFGGWGPWRLATIVCFTMVLVGCSVSTSQRSPALLRRAKWALLPIANHSETPQAGERLEAVLAALLRSRGIELESYSPKADDEAALLATDEQRYSAAFEWARAQKYDYAVTGAVLEWRYKSGIEGEPAVGMSLRVLDVPSGRTLWSGASSRAGWARESASGNAIKVADSLLDSLNFKR